ncbi:MAG: hypothetical protein RL653_4037 [Pseudomonadota bacterium]|jgi:hypothetical protein
MNARARLLLCALATSGCVRSELEPGANVQVVGRLVALGGTGAGGVDVALSRSRGNLCQEPLEPVAQGVTDEDGRYGFFLRGSDTQWDGLARCFRVAPGPTGEGTLARAEMLFQVTRPVVPPLLHAPFDLEVGEADGGSVAVSFRDFSQEAGGGVLRLLVRDAAGEPAWEADGPAPMGELDGALLEDFAGLTAQVRLEREGTAEKTQVALAWESPPVALGVGVDRVPVSRGAACSFGGEPGCPLTDGTLRAVGATADNLSVTLDFASPVSPAEIVVRGLRTWATPRRLEVTGATAAGLPVLLGTLGPDGGLGAFHRVSITSSVEPVWRLSLRWLDEGGQAVNVSGLSEVSVFDTP